MSDPVAKDEDVEDVLSSIRRLVSETDTPRRADEIDHAASLPRSTADDKAGVDHQTTSTDDAQDSAEPEKARESTTREALILTSDWRVKAEDTTPQQESPEAETTAPADDEQGDHSDLGSLRQAVSGAFIGEPVMPAVVHSTQNIKKAEEVSSALDTTKGWAAQPQEEYYEDEPDDELVASSDMPESGAWPVDPEMSEDEVAEDDAASQDAFAATPDPEPPLMQVEDVEAFREDAPDDEGEWDEDWRDEVGPENATGGIGAPSLSGETAIQKMASTDLSDDYEWDEEEDPAPQVATFRHVAHESAPSAAPEIHDADPVEMAPKDKTVTSETKSHDEAINDVPRPVDLSDLDETIIDEETLRELVSEIVRQELSGELGERITRNVRKLVRREIHRALLTREFD